MKEIKNLRYNEPHKFKKKANEDQFQRIHSAELCGRVAYQARKKKKTTLPTLNNRSSPVGTQGVHLKFTDATPASYVKRSCFSPSRRPSVGTCFACGKRSCCPTMDKLAKHPKFLNGQEGQQSGAVYSNLVICFFFFFQAVSRNTDQNRVLKCDVIKMKFLKLQDLSGYSERTMSKRPTCQK